MIIFPNFVNNKSTFLYFDTSTDPSEHYIYLTDINKIPPDGMYCVLIDDEIYTIDRVFGDPQFPDPVGYALVYRAQLGTVPAVHTRGTEVTCILTNSMLNLLLRNKINRYPHGALFSSSSQITLNGWSFALDMPYLWFVGEKTSVGDPQQYERFPDSANPFSDYPTVTWIEDGGPTYRDPTANPFYRIADQGSTTEDTMANSLITPMNTATFPKNKLIAQLIPYPQYNLYGGTTDLPNTSYYQYGLHVDGWGVNGRSLGLTVRVHQNGKMTLHLFKWYRGNFPEIKGEYFSIPVTYKQVKYLGLQDFSGNIHCFIGPDFGNMVEIFSVPSNDWTTEPFTHIGFFGDAHVARCAIRLFVRDIWLR